MGIKKIQKFNAFVIILILIFNTLLFSADAKKYMVAVTAGTATYNGKYSPQNCALMWIQKPDKTFIKTIYVGVKQMQYFAYFASWKASSGGKSSALDGLTGATRDSHEGTIIGYWDGTGRDNKLVPDGTYEFWVEMTENDGPGKATFGTIEIDGKAKKVNGTTTDFFPLLEANYDPSGVGAINKTKIVSNNTIQITTLNKHISVKLPNSNSYSVSLISPSGKVIVKNNGSGKNVILETSNLQMKCGVYLIKITQCGKTYSSQLIYGF